MRSTQLPKNSVGAKQLKKKAVTTAKLKDGAVSTPKIKDGAVDTAKIASNAVTGAKVDEASLAQVPSAAVAGSATTAASAADASTLGGIPSSGFQRAGDVLSGYGKPPDRLAPAALHRPGEVSGHHGRRRGQRIQGPLRQHLLVDLAFPLRVESL